MRLFFLLLVNVLFLGGLPQHLPAQVAHGREVQVETRSLLPVAAGEKSRYSIYIAFKKAYLGGFCVLLQDEGQIKGSIFNEFGVSAIDFTYRMNQDRVQLHHVFPPLDRGPVRRILRKNLLSLMHCMRQGELKYTDRRHRISYELTPLDERT